MDGWRDGGMCQAMIIHQHTKFGARWGRKLGHIHYGKVIKHNGSL